MAIKPATANLIEGCLICIKRKTRKTESVDKRKESSTHNSDKFQALQEAVEYRKKRRSNTWPTAST
jgi:hypothetical protein